MLQQGWKRLLATAWLILISACSNSPVSESAISAEQGYSDVSGSTLKVGAVAPGFELISSDGKLVSLESLRGQGVMIIFYRGYWCPFCIGHMDDIQSLLPELTTLGYQLLAISPDDIDGLKSMADRLENPYLFLSDPELNTIDAYGVRKDEELPHPAVIIVDTEGRVQWFYIGEDFKQRPSASQLRRVLTRLDQSGRK